MFQQYKYITTNNLRKIDNPSDKDYSIMLKTEEFTFLGDERKPDFGALEVTYIPGHSVIELKSFKEYLYQYRDIRISYERAINLLYEHLMHIYSPKELTIKILFKPRGGISSELIITHK